MKKIMLILVALVGFGIYTNAQTAQCKITNGNGATFTASVDSYDDTKGTVTVSAYNDADNSKGAVTGIVSVSFHGQTIQQAFIVPAGGSCSTPKTYKFTPWTNTSSSGPSISVSSAKCDK